MDAEISGFVVYVEAVIYLLLYDLHDCSFSIFCYDFYFSKRGKSYVVP